MKPCEAMVLPYQLTHRTWMKGSQLSSTLLTVPPWLDGQLKLFSLLYGGATCNSTTTPFAARRTCAIIAAFEAEAYF